MPALNIKIIFPYVCKSINILFVPFKVNLLLKWPFKSRAGMSEPCYQHKFNFYGCHFCLKDHKYFFLRLVSKWWNMHIFWSRKSINDSLPVMFLTSASSLFSDQQLSIDFRLFFKLKLEFIQDLIDIKFVI